MEAYVTLATDDHYALGALVLAHSIKELGTSKKLCILITPGVSEGLKTQLYLVFDEVVLVDVLNSNDSAHLALMKRPELGVTFTKLHCWTLTQYKKCVFLDADMLAVQNADEIFSQPELSAVPDVGWPDCFNSGLFVFVPSLDTYSSLLKLAESEGSFDGGDQGLLNSYFGNWNRLSFVYNMVASVTYTYLPAYKKFGKDVRFVHFLGKTKPWNQKYQPESGNVLLPSAEHQHLASYYNYWGKIYSTLVKPTFSDQSLLPHVPLQFTNQSSASGETNKMPNHRSFSNKSPLSSDILYQAQNIFPKMPQKNKFPFTNSFSNSYGRSEFPGISRSVETDFYNFRSFVDGNHVNENFKPHIPDKLHEINEEFRGNYDLSGTSTSTGIYVGNNFRPSQNFCDNRAQNVRTVAQNTYNNTAVSHIDRNSDKNRRCVNNDKNASLLDFDSSIDKSTDLLDSDRNIVNENVLINDSREENLLDADNESNYSVIVIPPNAGLNVYLKFGYVSSIDSSNKTLENSSNEKIKSTSASFDESSDIKPISTKFLKRSVSNANGIRVGNFLTTPETFRRRCTIPSQSRRNSKEPKNAFIKTSQPIGEEADQSEVTETFEKLEVNEKESIEEERQRWEEGRPEYWGRDSFDNILKHIETVMNENGK